MAQAIVDPSEFQLIAEGTYDGPCVYLLHLHRRFRHTQHYIGCTTNLLSRMNTHRKCLADSCSFMRAVHGAGIGFDLVRVWRCTLEDMRAKERQLKNTKKAAWFCLKCKPALNAEARNYMRATRAAKSRGQRC